MNILQRCHPQGAREYSGEDRDSQAEEWTLFPYPPKARPSCCRVTSNEGHRNEQTQYKKGVKHVQENVTKVDPIV